MKQANDEEGWWCSLAARNELKIRILSVGEG